MLPCKRAHGGTRDLYLRSWPACLPVCFAMEVEGADCGGKLFDCYTLERSTYYLACKRGTRVRFTTQFRRRSSPLYTMCILRHTSPLATTQRPTNGCAGVGTLHTHTRYIDWRVRRRCWSRARSITVRLNASKHGGGRIE